MEILFKKGDIVTFDRLAWGLYHETVTGVITHIITNKSGTYLMYRIVDNRNKVFDVPQSKLR